MAKKRPAPQRRQRVVDTSAEVGAATPPPAAPPAPTSWVDWYNNRAAPEQQRLFDNAASVIDNGGAPYQKGGTNEAYVENYRPQGQDFFDALVNYRDTHGRTALFATPPKDYGPRPISEVKKGGPIEQDSPTLLRLHPGRYSYTDVTANGPAFRQWLQIVQKGVVLGQTQISAAVLAGDPYYVDYEFTVIADTAWPLYIGDQKLHGNPTWVPRGINIIDYWGQVTSSQPDWDAPGRALSKAADMAKGIATLGGLLALAYVAYALKPATIQTTTPTTRRLA